MEITYISWIIFNVFVITMLVIDLTIFHRDPHAISPREAYIASTFWIALGLLFGVGIHYFIGSEAAASYFAGYLLEKSLSIDNLFVFLMIFSYFCVPKAYLHTVLFWGVLGALVMRAIFIFSGVALIEKFHWITYILGLFLIITGIKLMREKGEKIHPEKNLALRFFNLFLRMTPTYVNGHFFVKKDNRYWATPLFAVLVVVETTDVIFAIDSVPAILAITKDPFIVYTSNVFAILGLRSLYFALESSMGLFQYLNYGLASLLIFIGVKMMIAGYVTIPVVWVLVVIAVVLSISIGASIIYKTDPPKPPA